MEMEIPRPISITRRLQHERHTILRDEKSIRISWNSPVGLKIWMLEFIVKKWSKWIKITTYLVLVSAWCMVHITQDLVESSKCTKIPWFRKLSWTTIKQWCCVYNKPQKDRTGSNSTNFKIIAVKNNWMFFCIFLVKYYNFDTMG